MKNIFILFLLGAALTISLPASAQQPHAPSLFERKNLVAWCVVPFDKMKRTPQARAEMLNDLGITQLAWDWREEHLPLLAEEIKTLKKHNIHLKAVWFWVNGGSGEIMDEANHFILETLKEQQVKTELWLSFNDRFFENLSDEQKLKKAVNTISAINEKVNAIGCTLHLYNHGSWFGEPENQVKIIEETGAKNIGIVYNFHHARHQVKDFPRLITLMMPYLTTVNINGMKTNGPMILPVGEGDHEVVMLQQLKTSGYTGSLGVLSHVDDQDAKLVLKKNLDGLMILLEKMGEKQALKSYRNHR